MITTLYLHSRELRSPLSPRRVLSRTATIILSALIGLSIPLLAQGQGQRNTQFTSNVNTLHDNDVKTLKVTYQEGIRLLEKTTDPLERLAVLQILSGVTGANEETALLTQWKLLLARQHAAVRKHLSNRGFQNLRKQRLKLNELRSKALAMIFDPKQYASGHGQQTVDRLVNDVNKYWKRKPRPVRLGADYDRSVGLLELIARFGVRMWPKHVARSLKSIDLAYYRALAARRLSLQTFGMTGKEQLQLDYSVVVLNRNKTLQKQDKSTIHSSTEWEQIGLLNQYRLMMGLHPLVADKRLSQAAHAHSREMKKRGTMSHRFSGHPLGETPNARMTAMKFPAKTWGENIAKGYPRAREVTRGWYRSAPHHRGMLNPRFTHVGVGEVAAYWTQTFSHAHWFWISASDFEQDGRRRETIYKLFAARSAVIQRIAALPKKAGVMSETSGMKIDPKKILDTSHDTVDKVGKDRPNGVIGDVLDAFGRLNKHNWTGAHVGGGDQNLQGLDKNGQLPLGDTRVAGVDNRDAASRMHDYETWINMHVPKGTEIAIPSPNGTTEYYKSEGPTTDGPDSRVIKRWAAASVPPIGFSPTPRTTTTGNAQDLGTWQKKFPIESAVSQ